tara:strand:+ start:2387 stop:3130 length:744 start_codon:yes stop_codon:yes gene_type:complete
MNDISTHVEEYFESVKKIQNELCKANKPKVHPFNFADIMRESLITSNDWSSFNKKLGTSNLARRNHNYFGWMAYNDKPLGNCKGAIYRSKEYMEIPLHQRNGEKKHDKNEYGPHHIHIEHSIPVTLILRYFLNYKNIYLDNLDHLINRRLHEAFLSISVCTALTRHEEEEVIIKKYKDKHPELDEKEIKVDSLSEIHPFIRYDFSKGLKLYEMISGSEICPETFTLKDHINLINKVDIYKWDYINFR